jgi:hypothetical protein
MYPRSLPALSLYIYPSGIDFKRPKAHGPRGKVGPKPPLRERRCMLLELCVESSME